MKAINYKEVYNNVVEKLRSTKEIVIATSYKDKVTARTVYCICNGLDIYFITSKAYSKYKQIQKNNRVAFAINDIQVQGIAEDLGHPSTKENEFIKDVCEADDDYKRYYNNYSKYKNTVLIKVKPNLITLNKGKGTYEYLNIDNNTAFKKGR